MTSDSAKPIKQPDSDRSKPINDARLAALEELSALDQKLELEYGAKNRRTRWTLGEIEMIASFAGTDRELSKLLGRSINAIQKKRHLLLEG